MIFIKLKLNYFGRFHNREIVLKPGINLIYGENESGKSTVHTFIKGMLFGIERMRGRGSASKDDSYTHYLPWDYPCAFNGSMDILIGEKVYRLQRSFHANDKNFTLIDLSTGREVKLREGLISDLIPGLTESNFKNTISIEQLKAQTDAELAAQVRNYITNLSIAKSKEVNIAKAVNSLTDQRKVLDLAQSTTNLKALQAEMEEEYAIEEKIERLTIQLRELLSEEQELKRKMVSIEGAVEKEEIERMEQLPAIQEKYRSYQEHTRQSILLERQSDELQAKASLWEMEQRSNVMLNDDIIQAKKLSADYMEREIRNDELQSEMGTLNKDIKRNLFVSILPAGATAMLVILITWFQPLWIILSTFLFVAGIIRYTVLGKNQWRRQQKLEAEEMTLEQQKVKIQTKLSEVLQKNRVSSIEELSKKQEEILKSYYAIEHVKEQQNDLERRRNELEDNRDVIYETIMKYMQCFTQEEELSIASIQRLQEEIERRKHGVLDKRAEVNQQYELIQLRTQKLKWEISIMEGNEVQLLKNKERYAELEQKQNENAVELEAIKLALTAIRELSVEIHDSFGHQLNQAVSEIIGEVTQQKYTDLKVDEKLEVKVGWNGDYVLLDRLSAGTIDQIYFALRLAVADLLLGKEEIPLLLDDTFALYDETRVKSALTKIAKRKQTILFTCHKREQKLLEELKIPYHYVDLSCR